MIDSTITTKPKSPNSQGEDIKEPYLQLQLEAKIWAVLPMKYAQEVLSLSSRRITPMPNMPDCIIGLLNQRNRIVWVADLPQMLKMEPVDRNLQQYHMAIIRVQDIPLGLIVNRVKGVIRLNSEAIQSHIGLVNSSLEEYFQGYYTQEDKTLLVLNAKAIINSPILHSESI